ncbi:protein phosphatase CheZ [Marinospirillum minutulum]|uniref:protein phosphatase CheZ n=1 Tax=Marinospirillum minutulum TaxID=64974 RepID=UPI000401F30B|nr:protein phosphatase CheZ [Marinospirillum minutulum]
MRNTTSELVDKIEQGALADAVNLLQTINDARNRDLYQQVGQLTRALHDAIRDFHVDTRAAVDQDKTLSEMADATDRLNYVINLTQNAANRTMDKVEECLPIVSELGKEAALLRNEWGRLIRREMKPQEFRDLYRRIDTFLVETERQTDVLSGNFSEITLAQDYQDLTGQVVKKVITLVHEVEDSLVHLVKMASQVDRITGIQPKDTDKNTEIIDKQIPEGPVVNAEKRGVDVVSGQDEVDDLLSSLGF